MCLMANCKYVVTDSGGLQEETTALDIPCFTLRENTERRRAHLLKIMEQIN